MIVKFKKYIAELNKIKKLKIKESFSGGSWQFLKKVAVSYFKKVGVPHPTCALL